MARPRHHTCSRPCDCIRTDYIYEDRYASLGLAVLYRAPLAFLPDDDERRLEFKQLAQYLPRALRLQIAAIAARQVISELLKVTERKQP
jgi:hypothetical protein